MMQARYPGTGAIQPFGEMQLGELEEELGLQRPRRQIAARECIDMCGV
jgi:hypothetical protein